MIKKVIFKVLSVLLGLLFVGYLLYGATNIDILTFSARTFGQFIGLGLTLFVTGKLCKYFWNK
jgi:hypothetical protein